VASLRELLDAATPGPWRCGPRGLVTDHAPEGLGTFIRQDDAELAALAPELAQRVLDLEAFVAEARETLEWIKDWRDGAFAPAYYDKLWPVEMHGLAESTETFAAALIKACDRFENCSAPSTTEKG
jgi:hypothetical protein